MIIASNNPGKLAEIKQILQTDDIYSLKEKNLDIEVDEDQDTFLGNATKKVTEIYNVAREATIADDSGLCIDALDGFPGVLTHRFLGDDATDEMRNEYLVKQLEDKTNRSAEFICNIVYYDGNHTIVGEGILRGQIAKTRRGANGFGFDEIFELPDGRTLAELTAAEKNELSARSLALQDLKSKLANF